MPTFTGSEIARYPEKSAVPAPVANKPTLLNGEPVEVITTIDVNFTLSQ